MNETNKMPLSLEDWKRQPWWNPQMHSDTEYLEAVRKQVAHKATELPSGYRNNNPGKLRPSGLMWRGLCTEQKDPEFLQFKSLKWGFRAMLKRLVDIYDSDKKHRRLYDILDLWMPQEPPQNPAPYALKVGILVGRTPRESLPHPKGDKILWVDILLAMAEVENGTNRYFPRGYLRLCANEAWRDIFDDV